MKPLKIDDIMDQEVQNLSGGELQRVALALCLGKPADVYLIDEPSAYLDSEQRLVAAKVIKRYLINIISKHISKPIIPIHPMALQSKSDSDLPSLNIPVVRTKIIHYMRDLQFIDNLDEISCVYYLIFYLYKSKIYQKNVFILSKIYKKITDLPI